LEIKSTAFNPSGVHPMRDTVLWTIVSLCCLAGLCAGEEPGGGLAAIDIEMPVRASLADAWKAWTTNAGAQQWFAPKTNIDLKPGGAYEILFFPDKPPGQRGAEDQKVHCFLPREMLAFEWGAPPELGRVRTRRTWVVVRLADDLDGTVRVRLTHAGFAEYAAAHPEAKEEWRKARGYFAKAWPVVLENLRKHLEKDSAEDESRQITEGIIDAPADAVWAALTTKKGMEAWAVAHAEIDLRVGGKMLTHYNLNGKIGDANTIENIILAFEPGRMLTIRIGKPPEKFPFKRAVQGVWHVLTLEEAGPGHTRLREAGLGYGGDDESKQLRAFFKRGNAYMLKKLQEHFIAKTKS
jgi:uncharacterized protein YndB with AHSA1/START domain